LLARLTCPSTRRHTLCRADRAYISVAGSALVVAAAGPYVLPDASALVAFIVVDERGLAAWFIVPLVNAVWLLLHVGSPVGQGAQGELLDQS
jgi:hypothetical protein